MGLRVSSVLPLGQLGDVGKRLPLLGLPISASAKQGLVEAPEKEAPSTNVWHRTSLGATSSDVMSRPEGRRAPGHGNNLVPLAGGSSAWI